MPKGKVETGSRKQVQIAFHSMRQRCYNRRNPAFVYYGARGITVEYRSTDEIIADIGLCPGKGFSIDRINNDGNYAPGNCCWSTRIDQVRNMRSNRYITAKGRTQLLVDWARETGLSASGIVRRLKNGWAEEDAVNPNLKPKGYGAYLHRSGRWEARLASGHSGRGRTISLGYFDTKEEALAAAKEAKSSGH